MKKIRAVLLLIIFIRHPLAGQCQTLSENTDSSFFIRRDTINSEAIREAAESIWIVQGVPGMTYTVCTKDSILEFQTLGCRVFKQKDTIERNDRFNIGTNSMQADSAPKNNF